MKSNLKLIAFVCVITISLVTAQWCGNHECEVGENCSWCSYDCGTCESWKVFKHCVDPRHLVLSFDDGPNEWTDPILDVLKAKNATAAFFFAGMKVTTYGDRMKRAWQEGHSIGTHTMHHSDLAWLSVPGAIKEVDQMINEVERIVGAHPVWFRPPFGSFTRELNDLLVASGQRVVLWNLDPVDWQNPLATQMHIFESALNSTDFGGFISVQHGNSHDAVDAIGLEIDMVRARGYELVSMEECAGNPVVVRDPNYIPPWEPDAAILTGPNTFSLMSVLLFLFYYLL